MPPVTQIPAKYLCSITGQIMIDPVVTADGLTFPRLFGHVAKIVKSSREVLYESKEINFYQKTSEI
jgi:hypothetical protein